MIFQAGSAPRYPSRASYNRRQLWNDLLCCSRGGPKIPKCACHLAHYGFSAQGDPVLTLQSQPAVRIQERSKFTTASLQYLPRCAAHETVGCYKSPSDYFKKRLAYNPATKSDAVLHNFVTAKSAHRYYYSVFLSSVTYSFPTNVIPEGQLRNIQNASMRPILNHLGFAKSTPHDILYGPQPLRGTGLRLFYDEQCSSKVKLVLNLPEWIHLDVVGRLTPSRHGNQEFTKRTHLAPT
jgi:hypothetical protein